MPAGDGLDTALARHLLGAGVALELLRGALDEVRAADPAARDVGLATLLLARGLVPPELIEQWAEASRGGAASSSQQARPGRQIGDYVLERELARGGMGVVYEAVHTSTGVRVALKTLLLTVADAESRARFEREALAQARLRHPAIVPIHTAALHGSTPYLVQELVPGGSLGQRLRAGPLPIADALAVVRRVGEALVHAHAREVLHRDLKPGNVLFDEHGQACLTDFGLAALAGADRLTATGEVMGTPTCMAPEQASDARSVDARADVYGLGAILYACLTGKAPFAGHGGVFQTLNAVFHLPPRPPHAVRPDVPPELEAACLRALSKAPDDRFADVAAFLEALRPSEATPRRGRALGVALALVAAGVALGVSSLRGERSPVAVTPAAAQPVRPLRDVVLSRLAGGGSIPDPLEVEALTAIATDPAPAEWVRQLEELPASRARESLLALALLRADRFAELAGRGGAALPPRAARLQAFAEAVLEAEAHYGRVVEQQLTPTIETLERAIRRVTSRGHALAPDPGSPAILLRGQRVIARLLTCFELVSGETHRPPGSQRRLDPALLEEAHALAPGLGRRVLDLALAYQGDDLDASRVGRDAVRGLPLSPREQFWLTVVEAELRLGFRWRPAPPWEQARRWHALDMLERSADCEGSLQAFSLFAGESLGHARAFDLLNASWGAHRAGSRDLGHALARVANRDLGGGTHGLVYTQVRLVRRLLSGELGPADEFAVDLAGQPLWQAAFVAEHALARGDLAGARQALGAFPRELLAVKHRPPEFFLVWLHVLILEGAVDPQRLQLHPLWGHALGTVDVQAELGFFWHRPEYFLETVRGAWWPGREHFPR